MFPQKKTAPRIDSGAELMVQLNNFYSKSNLFFWTIPQKM
jgi:hypothetical protein